MLELWNSIYYQEFRSKLLTEKKSNICKKCYSVPSLFFSGTKNVEGARTIFDDKLGSSFTDYSIFSNLNQVTFIELWFSNKCNLKCRMCSPKHSNQLIKDWNSVVDSTKDSKYFSYLEDILLPEKDWTEDENSWDNLFNFVKAIQDNNPNQIITFIMSGGEPAICDGMYKFFDLCLEYDIAKNIILSYNTNLTVLPSKMLSHWKNFKQIELTASIDGFNEVNNYIRYPSQWEKIVNNISLLRELQTEINISLQVRPTIQIYNILSITELYNWCLVTPFSNSYNHIGFGRLSNPLVGPEILNITALPKPLKDLSAKRLIKFFEDHKDFKYLINNNFERGVRFILKYMYSKDSSYLFPDFLRFTTHLDKSRNQNILDIMPELRQL